MNARKKWSGAVRPVSEGEGKRSVFSIGPLLLAVMVCLFCIGSLTFSGCQTRTKGQYDVSMGRSGK